MQIEVLTVPDCPNRATALARVRQALLAVGGPPNAITEQVIDDPHRAREAGMHGSPTILLEGRDPFASPGTETSVSCRLYPTGAGPAGAPSLEELISAMSTAGAGV